MKVGCLGLCYAEPLIYIKMAGRPIVCYGHSHPDNVHSLVDKISENENINNDLALGSIDFPEINVLPVPGLPRSMSIP